MTDGYGQDRFPSAPSPVDLAAGDTVVGAAAGPALREPDAIRPAEPSVTDLVSEVTKDLAELVGMHVDLAKAELKDDVAQAVGSARELGIAAFAAYMAVIMLSFASAFLLAEWVPTWAGLGIVTVVWAIVAGVMFLRGRARLHSIAVDETVTAVKEDVQWAQQQRS